MRKIAVGTCVTLLVSFSWLTLASAQQRARVAWAGSSMAPSPVWVAQDRGFFKRNGLDAEIVVVSSGVIALQALLAGEVEIIVVSGSSLVNSRLSGADTVMVATLVPYFMDHVIALPNITSVEQFKGKTGGVNRQGTVSEMGLRHALKRLGIDPDKDVKIISVGGNPERIAALSRNLIHFSIMGEPFVREAEKAGMKSFVDIGALKIPFHTNGILARETVIRSRRSLVARFVRAVTEAINYIKTDKAGTKSVVEKKFESHRCREPGARLSRVRADFSRSALPDG
jgi:NitT/TauT family transport system substrate-binding protein